LCRCGTRQCAVLPDRLLLPRAAFGQATDQRMAFGGWLKQWHKKRKALPAAGSVSCISFCLLLLPMPMSYVLYTVYCICPPSWLNKSLLQGLYTAPAPRGEAPTGR
jgi:hypothetical protein